MVKFLQNKSASERVKKTCDFFCSTVTVHIIIIEHEEFSTSPQYKISRGSVIDSPLGIPPKGQCNILDDKCCEPDKYQCNYGGPHSGYICKTPYRFADEVYRSMDKADLCRF
jgi:hypothetical protein